MDLLGLSVTNKPSSGRCAFERDRVEQKTRECGCDMRLFGEGLDGESESGLPVDCIGGKRMSSLLSRVSPTTNPASLLGHCFGGKPTPCGTAGSDFSGLLPQAGIRLGPRSRKCTLGTWESAPLARLRRV
jgi:hypothetical protein